MITIEKGIPIPTTRSDIRDALRKMKIGESFLIPKGRRPPDVYYAAKQLSIPVRICKDENGQHRVFRVEKWWRPADDV